MICPMDGDATGEGARMRWGSRERPVLAEHQDQQHHDEQSAHKAEASARARGSGVVHTSACLPTQSALPVERSGRGRDFQRASAKIGRAPLRPLSS